MQIEIELTEQEMEELTKLAEKRPQAWDDVVRTAVSQYLDRESALEKVIGLWADRNEDGLAYQERLRAEWDDR